MFTVYHDPLYPVTQKCKLCGIEKNLSEFYPDKAKKSGYKSKCKKCIRDKPIIIIQTPLPFADSVNSKTCLQCHMEKPLSEFHKKASSKDGLAFCCKECRNQFGRDAYIALPKEQRKIIRRQKYLSNREYQLEHARRYIAKHPEKRRKYQSTYVAKYPLRAREFTRRYKARKKFATNGKVDYSLIIKQFGYICHICNGTIDHNDLHMDHVIPLSRGGAHSQGNLMPSHSICNLRKHDKLMEELTEYERRGPNA